MKRVLNFNAGPTALPLDVLTQAQQEFLDYQGQGMNVMEMSHREACFEGILDRAKKAIIALYDVPDDYDILFLQGGASLQFAMIPMNFGVNGGYLNTGVWSTNALQEAKIIGNAYELWSSQKDQFSHVPQDLINIPESIADQLNYLHYTSNNTIYGTQYHHLPKLMVDQQLLLNLPLFCDVSSDFLSRPLDIKQYDFIYAGAQKNAGPSGVTIVIAKKELLAQSPKTPIPKILQYKIHAEKDSMYNTPNTYGIYILMLMCEWMIAQGGVNHFQALNLQKANLIYDVLDRYADVFEGHARKHSRSLMNITFRLKNEKRLDELLKLAQEKEIIGIKGHRSVGGMRISLYNAVPLSSTEVLAQVLQAFAQKA